jgi:hypothetical protein
MLSWLPLVTSTSGGSRRRPEPPSGAGLSASQGAQKSSNTATTNAPTTTLTATASQSPIVPAPLGNRFQPATSTAQPPTVSAHVSAAQRRARDPLATSTGTA